jgi:hypothetical protein
VVKLLNVILVELLLRYESRRAAVPVVFGESGDAQVLGITTLETLGY